LGLGQLAVGKGKSMRHPKTCHHHHHLGWFTCWVVRWLGGGGASMVSVRFCGK